MTSHQQKKLDFETLRQFRDRFALPLRDCDVESLQFFRPPEDSAEMRYLRARRSELGGYLPTRNSDAPALSVPQLSSYADFALNADGKSMSTTMAVVRMFSNLLRDKTLGPRIVPIVADEARTFGMANLFRQIGIYSPAGQLYEPEDAASLLSYREARDGQILEEGITEAGAISSWVAAATAYSVHGTRLLPFYIFYSMFGFQRVGDLIWAAADQRSRGFLFGATSGRTTLGGEGLQHQDGSSHVIAATVPNCRAYDPAFACDLAVIIDHGARQMMQGDQDQFFYITVMNENYPQPSAIAGSAGNVIKGMYRYRSSASSGNGSSAMRLLGCGAILPEVIEASDLLREHWQLDSEVWSVTSFSELARDAAEVERWNRLHPQQPPRSSHVRDCLSGNSPIVAASDYVRAYPQLISPYLTAPYNVLGTDGFGRSDTRAALRRFFEVDRQHIVVCALSAAADKNLIERTVVQDAIVRFGLDAGLAAPWTR
jgi:pyruvate dehydrogenase E1 component